MILRSDEVENLHEFGIDPRERFAVLRTARIVIKLPSNTSLHNQRNVSQILHCVGIRLTSSLIKQSQGQV